MIKLIWNECNEYENEDVNNQIGTIVKDLKKYHFRNERRIRNKNNNYTNILKL